MDAMANYVTDEQTYVVGAQVGKIIEVPSNVLCGPVLSCYLGTSAARAFLRQ